MQKRAAFGGWTSSKAALLSDRVIIVPLALKDKDPVLLDGIYEAIFFIDPPAPFSLEIAF